MPSAVSGEDGGGAWRRDHEACKNSYTDLFLLDFFENLFCFHVFSPWDFAPRAVR